jgi:hypothetical protein
MNEPRRIAWVVLGWSESLNGAGGLNVTVRNVLSVTMDEGMLLRKHGKA